MDQRVRLLSEVVNNIRAVKVYAYETYFSDRVANLRRQEHAMLRKYGFNRSIVSATFWFVPTLASVRKCCVLALHVVDEDDRSDFRHIWADWAHTRCADHLLFPSALQRFAEPDRTAAHDFVFPNGRHGGYSYVLLPDWPADTD